MIFYLLGGFTELWKATISFIISVCLSFCPSVHMEQLGSHWMYCHEIWYLSIFQNLSQKLKFHKNLTRIMGTLRIVSCSVLLRMINVSDRSFRENQNTYLMFDKFFWKLFCLWDNVEKFDKAREATHNNIIWHMRIACWITKATNTH